MLVSSILLPNSVYNQGLYGQKSLQKKSVVDDEIRVMTFDITQIKHRGGCARMLSSEWMD